MARKKTNKSTKKKSVDSLEQTHGKIENPAQAAITKAKELDVILGMRKMSPYGTASLAVFEEKLKDMNLADMREVAVTAGIFPNGNKTSLKKKLIKGFLAHNKGSAEASSAIQLNHRTSAPNSALQQEIDDIWAGKK